MGKKSTLLAFCIPFLFFMFTKSFGGVGINEAESYFLICKADAGLDSSAVLNISLPSLLHPFGVEAIHLIRRYPDNSAKALFRLTVVTHENIDDVISLFELSGLFDFIERDFVSSGASIAEEIAFVPDDPFVHKQWYINNDGSFPNGLAKAGADIQLHKAWAIETGSEEVTVAILDSGIKPDHPEFADRIWKNKAEANDGADTDNNTYVDDLNGWNFVDNNNLIRDDNGHGTHVSSVIGSNGNNAIGFAGIDWKCKLMICKVLDRNLNGFYSDWIEAIYYATDMQADVINMSFGGVEKSKALEEAVNYAFERNVMLVSSMQNDNEEIPYYPAAYSNVIAVGASNPDDTRSTSFINTIPGGSNYGNHIDVIAPGNYIYGLGLRNNYYANVYGGTSLATPVVSGILSLLFAHFPDLTNAQIYAKLMKSCDDEVGKPTEDVPGWDKYHGFGRVNAFRALSETNTNIENSPLIFPNPAMSSLFIKHTLAANSPFFLSLLNLQGQEIIKMNFSNLRVIDLELDMYPLSAGIYILNLQSDSETITRKISVIK